MKHTSSEFSGEPLVGTVSTFYKDRQDPRFELALQTAETYRDLNLPLVVIDGSEEKWVGDALAERDANVIRSDINGIATQRQQGVASAIESGAEKVVGHEPEKVGIPLYSAEISNALNQNTIVVIGRTAMALETLPSVQLKTEHLAGWILEKTHDLPADALSGGRGFTKEGAELLAEYPSQEPGMNNWIYLYETPLEARSKGLSVGGLQIDLMHPESMTNQEEGSDVFDRKRYDQFKLQLDYLLTKHPIRYEGQEIATEVLETLHELAQETNTDGLSSQIDRLTRRLAAFGYAPRHSGQ